MFKWMIKQQAYKFFKMMNKKQRQNYKSLRIIYQLQNMFDILFRIIIKWIVVISSTSSLIVASCGTASVWYLTLIDFLKK